MVSLKNVLPREITYNVVSDEPIHIDFLRIVPGVKIRIEVPVEFINHETSPGLKRGGVLNIVRRKIELKCPSEKIPSAITIDLDGVDIGGEFSKIFFQLKFRRGCYANYYRQRFCNCNIGTSYSYERA